MKNRYTTFLFLLFTIFAITTCQKKDEDPAAKLIFVYMNITDDSGKPVSGANVYVLSRPEDFESSSALYKGVNPIDSTISANGKATIVIQGEKEYFLYITLKDEVRKLVLTNEGYSNVINKLPSKLNVTVDIKLTPANANIAFWTKDVNKLPITLKIDNETFTITNSLTDAPVSVNASGIVVKNVRKGIHNFYATNADGCVWTESVNIKKGEFKTFEMPFCKTNEVVFYTSAFNKALLPIRILINDTDDIGSVASTLETYKCGEAQTSTLTVKREIGSFTYVAYSKDNKCTWTGSFVTQEGKCTVVKLDECK